MTNSVLLLSVFTCSTLSTHSKQTVNVALETSLLFEPKEYKINLGLVNNMRSFLDKIHDTLEPQAELFYRQHEDTKTLPDFLYRLGSKFLSYNNDAVQQFTNVLKDHINAHTSKARSTFHEIFSEPSLKKFLVTTVEQLSSLDGEKIKKKLRKFMKYKKPVLGTFTDKLNKYYTEEDVAKFHDYVKKLDKHVDENKDFSNIIKECLDFGIFDRYNKLNYTSKVSLLNDMNVLANYVKDDTNFRATDSAEDKFKQEDISGSKEEDVATHHRHSHAKDVVGNKIDRNTISKEKESHGKKTEVIVDNVEFFIKTVED